MKIVRVDNYDKPTPDVLIAENVPAKYAEIIKKALNKEFSSSTSTSPDYFTIFPDDYKLRTSPEDF